jgi:2OG-Fe(II) oxygenase superfamily
LPTRNAAKMDLNFSFRNRCGYLIRQNDNIEKAPTQLILNKSKIIDPFNVSDEDVQWMKDNFEQAKFSDHNVDKIDVGVRNSKYCDDFELRGNFGDDFNIDCASHYKVNVYEKGNFFDFHRDTDRDGLCGTLVLLLPTHYEGGSLVFEDSENYEEEYFKECPKNAIKYIYFDHNLYHKVTPLTDGHRVSIIFNVYLNRCYAPNKCLDCCNEANEKLMHVCLSNSVVDSVVDKFLMWSKNKSNILMASTFRINQSLFLNFVKKLLELSVPIVKVSTIKNDTSKIKRVYLLEEFSGGYRKFTIDSHTLSLSNFDKFEKCNSPKGNDAPYFDCYFKFRNTIEGCYNVQHVLFDDTVNGELKSDKYYYVRYGRYRGNESVYYPRNIVYYVAYLINPQNFVESRDVYNDSEEEADHDCNTPYYSDTDLEESYEGGKLSEEFD